MRVAAAVQEVQAELHAAQDQLKVAESALNQLDELDSEAALRVAEERSAAHELQLLAVYIVLVHELYSTRQQALCW